MQARGTHNKLRRNDNRGGVQMRDVRLKHFLLWVMFVDIYNKF